MNSKIKRIAIDGILLATLIVASKLSIPVLTISFTVQILVVLVIALITSLLDGTLIIITYLAMGLIGIPVFSTAAAGVGYLVVPSFGFIIGFIAMVLVANLLKKSFTGKLQLLLLGILVLVDYACGFVYVIFIAKVFHIIELNLTVWQILLNFIIIFIPFDIIKCLIANKIIIALNNSQNQNDI